MVETGRIFVTGANGFLGSEITRQAIISGFKIYATDRSSNPTKLGYEYYQGDLQNCRELLNPLRKSEIVIHAAGLAHMNRKGKNIDELYKYNNEICSENLAQTSQEAGVKHFILISSVSVYGSSFKNNFIIEETPCIPRGSYAKSKFIAEKKVIEIAHKSKMAVTILRLVTLYGEKDPGNVGRLMRSIDRGRFVWVGNGTNRKTLLHKEDAARACLAAIKTPKELSNIFNVSASFCNMREIVNGLAFFLGKRIPRFKIPASGALFLSRILSLTTLESGRAASIYENIKKWLSDEVYDGSKFERKFDFRPKVSLQEGLRREVEWYRSQSGRNNV